PMLDRRVGQLRPLTKEDRGCQPEQSTGWLLCCLFHRDVEAIGRIAKFEPLKLKTAARAAAAASWSWSPENASQKTTTRRSLGSTSLRSSIRLAVSSGWRRNRPVVLPPGRASPWTWPLAIGS